MYQQFSSNATVIFGNGAVSVIGEKVKELGCKKAMCVLDKGVESTGIGDRIVHNLRDNGIDAVVFNAVVADPHVGVVNEGGDLARKEGVDCLIGIGGGSSMDTAKAISVLLTMPGRAEDYILARPIFIDTKTPVILVPTTAGTGSEVTAVAVISRPELNAKWSVFVNTTYAIVDPELTLSMPKSVTANTGLDALSHAAEALTGKNWNPHSDVMGEAAIRRLAKYLVTAYHEPDNLEARTQVMLAANFAGFAFNDPITHVGHAAADAMSVHFHTPHGYNCGICLPAAMKFAGPHVPEKMRLVAEALGVELTGAESGKELGALVADKLYALMRALEVKSIRELGYDRETFMAFVPDVMSNHLSSFFPVEVTTEVASDILADIYDSYQ